MTVRASITAQSFILGEVRADAARLRGEGGPVSPVLVVPLTVALNPQPIERTMVMTELWGRLELDGAPTVALGEPRRATGPGQSQGMWASHPNVAATHEAELRVPLSAAQLRSLEQAPMHAGNLALRLELRTTAAWLRE